jgi:hypothetical protein
MLSDPQRAIKAENSEPDQGRLVAFVHIPKTAGQTLNAILAQQYARDEVHEVMMRGMSLRISRPALIPSPMLSFSKTRRLKAALKNQHKLRLIRGHFDLSLSKLLPADTRFFTLLRDPVERAISHYYHFRRKTTDPIHPLAMRSTLMEWVSACGLVEMDNGQTRRLAGKMNLPCGRVTLEMLERAKSNLAAMFAVVGLTERFEESLVLLHRAFNWPPHRIQTRNVGDNRPLRAELSGEALELISNCNRFDLDLYRFAAARFEQALSKIDKSSELARLNASPEYVKPA